MMRIRETCTCGASTEVFSDYGDDVRREIATWREIHRACVRSADVAEPAPATEERP